jgi:hypothetical protein
MFTTIYGTFLQMDYGDLNTDIGELQDRVFFLGLFQRSGKSERRESLGEMIMIKPITVSSDEA